MNTDKLESLGMYNFVRTLAAKRDRWYNFDVRSSSAFPFELMKDQKVIHYKWKEKVDEIFIKPVVDVIFTVLPEQSAETLEKERSEMFEWFRENIKPNGFHFRFFMFKKDEVSVGFVLRIFADEDFPCYVHPEYITHSQGRSPCPACYTAVTFGEFHPIEIKPVDSRFMEKTS